MTVNPEDFFVSQSSSFIFFFSFYLFDLFGAGGSCNIFEKISLVAMDLIFGQ